MTVVGEYRYSALGLFITVFGVVLAAVKVWHSAVALELQNLTDPRIDRDNEQTNDRIFGTAIYGTSVPHVTFGSNPILRFRSTCR